MASRAISGKPGGGKTYLAVKWVIEELLNTERPIVTNLELIEDGIAEFLAKNHPEKDIDVFKRITRLDIPKPEQHEKMAAFWRYRGNGLVLPNISDNDVKAGIRPDELAFGGGVHYFLDELHKFLNARQWSSTGPLLLWYITQHRHFGDDVTWITQKIGYVDAQWRGVTQDYTYVRNFGKEKWRGFTKGTSFHRDVFLEPFTGLQTPQESEDFKPDWEGIGKCYHTSIAHGAADKGQKNKGLPVWVLYALVCLGALIVCLLFIYGPGAVSKWMVGSNDKASEVVRKNMGINPAAAVGNGPHPSKAGAPLDTPKIEKENEFFNVAVPLRSITCQEALAAMQGTGGEGISGCTIRASSFGNSLVITGSNLQNILALSETVKLLDAAKPEMVMIQAVILRTSSGRSSNVGVWRSLQDVVSSGGFGVGSLSFDPVAGLLTMGSITAAQELLLIMGSQNIGRFGFEVESRPNLAASSGSEAWFTSGQEVPVPVTTQNVGNAQTSVNYKKVQFSLGVRPVVLPDGRIAVTINQSNDDILKSVVVSGNSVPTVATQSLNTRLELAEGQIAVLGGIKVTSREDDSNAFPVLGVLPPLSWFFGNRDKKKEESELLIMLTVFRVPSGANPLPVRKAIAAKNFAHNVQTAPLAVSKVSTKKKIKK